MSRCNQLVLKSLHAILIEIRTMTDSSLFFKSFSHYLLDKNELGLDFMISELKTSVLTTKVAALFLLYPCRAASVF